MEMSGESLFVIASIHYIIKAVLYQRNNDTDHISEAVPNSLDRQAKTNPSIDFTEHEK
jgi:hypothetical protein